MHDAVSPHFEVDKARIHFILFFEILRVIIEDYSLIVQYNIIEQKKEFYKIFLYI